ncbi:MAG: hypothetical protein KAS32_00735 [Candidatus Peribacteraceae bacterium]|nr:hypothetical protein [Candidatus Peribacteraceae bacterium]
MLKFEGFEKGDQIRGYDFEPIVGRKVHYIEGVITEVNPDEVDYKSYKIIVINDSGETEGRRVGLEMYIPMQMSMLDFDNRVVEIVFSVVGNEEESVPNMYSLSRRDAIQYMMELKADGYKSVKIEKEN